MPRPRRRGPLRRRHAQSSLVRFGGGLDTETPRRNVDPGRVQAAINYEVGVERGYRDIDGFERFDGRKSPHSESFTSLGVQLTEELQSYAEFGGNDPDKKLIGQEITSLGDHLRFYPITSQLSLNEAFTLNEGLNYSENPIAGIVGNNSTRPFGYTEVAVEFHEGFVRHFTDTSLQQVQVFFDYVLLNRGVWVLETTTTENSEWSEKIRLHHWAIGDNDPAGSENIDSDGTTFHTISDGGWRRVSVTLDAGTNRVQLRPLEAGTIAVCCVESRVRSSADDAVVSTVIAVDRVEETNVVGERLIVADTNGDWIDVPLDDGLPLGRKIFIKDAPEVELTRIIQNHIVDEEGSTPEKLAIFKAKAANAIRNYIQKVPGSGPITGIWMLRDTVYAARNNETNTAQDIYKSTATGWTKVTLHYEAKFTGGVSVINDGDMLTIGDDTVEVLRVVVEKGVFGAQDGDGNADEENQAQGRVIVAEATGAGVGTVGGDNVATFVAATRITLPPHTEANPVYYETVRGDFGPGYRVYGVNGRNSAFEMDSNDLYVPIRTTNEVDVPRHVTIFQSHLFLSFGRSLQHSSIGDPYMWQFVTGAREINTTSPITGLLVEPGEADTGALAVFNRDQIWILYGQEANNWHLQRYREEVGAYERSIQEVTNTIFLDDRGLRSLQTVQAYGNFVHATISEHCRSFLQETGRFGESNVVGSCLIRQKNQYRIFFKDGYGLAVTFKRQHLAGIMPLYFDLDISFVYSSEDAKGIERSFIGGADGYVYEMERGTSFDGEPISAFLYLHFHYPGKGSIGRIKRFLSGSVEVAGTDYATFQMSAVVDYNKFQQSGRPRFTDVISNIQNYWDTSYWDEFHWDGRILGEARVSMKGYGENIAVLIRKNSDYMKSVLISGIRLRYAVGKDKR